MNKTIVLLAFVALLVSAQAAETWETRIGQGFTDLAGNQTCTNAFYTGTDCGFYMVGILAMLVFIGYIFATGLSSEAGVPLTGLLLMFLASRGFMPAFVGVSVVLIAGVLIYKGLSQVPNG